MEIPTDQTNTGVSFPRVFVPGNIRLNGDLISWDRPDFWNRWRGGANWTYRRFTDRTLLSFAKLYDQPAEKIFEFARLNGVFGAKLLGAEGSALPNELLLPGERWLERWRVDPEIKDVCVSEPLSVWRSISRTAYAMLRIHSALRGRDRNPTPTVGLAEDWKWMCLDCLESYPPEQVDPPEQVEQAQVGMYLQINSWLSIGRVRLQLMPPIPFNRRKSVSWDVQVDYGDGEGYNLFGALAYRIFLMVAGEGRLYVCDACKEPYIRRQDAPRSGKENFCENEDCKKVARMRALKRFRDPNKPGKTKGRKQAAKGKRAS